MKNLLYNLIINDLTRWGYQNCLNYFAAGSSILDVGIGNGGMLRNFHSVIRSKSLTITGIDINRYYLEHCHELIKEYGLEDHIRICRMPVENYEPPGKACFDFILFSMSFMLFRDQDAVLERIRNWLRPDGEVIFFQTIHQDRSRLLEFIKPRLKFLTTVEFGKVTYENEFLETLKRHNLAIVQDILIKKSWHKGEYRIVIAKSS